MTGLSLYCAGAALGLVFVVISEAQTPADVPWHMIANGSATAAVLVVGFFLLRRESQERQAERTAFTNALRDVTSALSEKMENISSRFAADNERADAALREFFILTREDIKELTTELRARKT